MGQAAALRLMGNSDLCIMIDQVVKLDMSPDDAEDHISDYSEVF